MPVAIDDWYARREQTAEGEFFRLVADQGPKPSANFHTRQGMYAVTPAGRLLAYKNRGESPEMTRLLLADGLKGWAELHEEDPTSAVTVAHDDSRYHRAPPTGGLALGVRQRRLTRTANGYDLGVPDKPGGQLAMRQTVWFTANELSGLIPPVDGTAVNIPYSVRARLARFHTPDMTQGDGVFWPRASLRQLTMTARTSGAIGSEQLVRFDGRFELEHPTEGRCRARLRGEATWNVRQATFVQFEWVLVSDHSPASGNTWVSASLFRLPDPNDVADHFPPDGLKTPVGYWRNGQDE